MWRRRRWRYLLNLIDHLPQNSHFHQAVTQDEHHAALLAEAGAFETREGAEKWAPSQATYSPEVEVMWTVVNEIRLLNHTLTAVNSKTPPKEPELIPAPRTAFDKYRSSSSQVRQKKHLELAARVLPHKREELLRRAKVVGE